MWRVSHQRCYLSIKLNGVTLQKTILLTFTVVINFDMHYCILFCSPILWSKRVHKISGIHTVQLIYCDCVPQCNSCSCTKNKRPSYKAHYAKAVMRRQSQKWFSYLFKNRKHKTASNVAFTTHVRAYIYNTYIRTHVSTYIHTYIHVRT
jgi:hypothetical protein